MTRLKRCVFGLVASVLAIVAFVVTVVGRFVAIFGEAIDAVGELFFDGARWLIDRKDAKEESLS